ncbi:unnamed protein product [Ilex paraguariensis]|uniref:RHS protein conserved region domain-containing protein n=1 Tax=Ilex paraguariensis TaxID=185542 RepID=A0ABC8V2R7_9AQUA
MQQDAARHLRHTLDHGLPPGAQAMLGEQADSTARLLNGMQAKLQEQEKEQHARIAIHHYHCDHLGTPMALTDQTGQVAWAAKLDPWGNVLQEYNPQGIHQAIRLPGQHHDRETGLYYNRHRYYDPVVGSYVNQDPVGLAGGFNLSLYVSSQPLDWIDPLGLDGVAIAADRAAGLNSGSLIDSIRNAPRSDGTPLGAGCGDSKSDNFVPDKPFGFNFLPACQAHDKCYGNKSGPSKEQCDKSFKEDMLKECKDKSWPKSKICKGSANDYYKAVDLFGDKAFDNARK